MLVQLQLRNNSRNEYGRMTLHSTSTGHEPNVPNAGANMDTSGSNNGFNA